MLWVLRHCLLLALVLCASPGHAQTELSDDQFERLTQRWHHTLDSISSDLTEFTIVGKDLDELRANIRIVAESAEEVRDRAAAAAAAQQALFDALGPPPAEGEPAEDPVVATERSLIVAQRAHDLGRVARSNVVLARTRDLLERTVTEETAALLDAINEPTVSPLMPSVVMAAVGELRDRLAELTEMAARSWRSSDLFRPWSRTGATLLAIVALTFLIALPLRRWLLTTYGPDPSLDAPSPTRRFQATTSTIAVNAVLPALIIAGFQLVLSESPVVSGELRFPLSVFLAVALDVVPLVGLVFAILAPGQPAWRISRFADKPAKRISRAVRTYAVLLLVLAPSLSAISPVYAEGRLIEIAGARAALGAIGGLLGVVLLGLAMLNLMRPRNWRNLSPDDTAQPIEQPRSHSMAQAVMVLVVLGVIASMVLSGVGYINLGVFVSKSMTRTLVVIGYALCLRAWLHEGLHVATSDENAVGRWLRHRLLLDDDGATRLIFWLTLIIDAVLGALVLGTSLVMWGMPGAVLQEGADLAIDGVDVGGFNLSLVNIGLALGVLVTLLAAIHVFQRFLADRVLVQTRLELGVRDALATGVSYVGYVLAALITLSVLGLDISNIALIFGALSVGIGFGLQHVVSNFVSGLILLIQRPIKTGDWIVVGDQQGYVRRISVISTEIQTFDAAAVIVPNSTMLSSQVINWHLHNKLGRVIVPVGVSYDSDPEQVRNVLLACADKHPEILKRPTPQVLFRNFGDSSLDFELRFFLREIDGLLRVSSEMRFAIQKAFRDSGIQIPYPQRDVHLRGAAPSPDRDRQGESGRTDPATPLARPS